jgi:ABC-type phosphate/phosphonate transport system substrate-binding protein
MITSFRMYNAVPRAGQAWRALFERVFSDVGVDIRVIEHAAPDPIDALWKKPDLCCAFMCGWPFVRSGAMQAIAAPVPTPPRYQDLPRYCSEFLVRESSGWRSLEQTFGHRFGWMAENSQSGFNAPRAHLARFATPDRPALYSEVRGPFGTPMKTLDALRNEEVDVVALDSFFLDLCRYHEPTRLSDIRCVATTAWTPIPLLVAAPSVDNDTIGRLQRRLLAIDRQASYAILLADVLLKRFVAPDVASYRELESQASYAIATDYEEIR